MSLALHKLRSKQSSGEALRAAGWPGLDQREAPEFGKCCRPERPCTLIILLLASFLLSPALGCGLNKSRLATEQLVISDAVDEAVAGIDFKPLSGRTVFLDVTYLDKLKPSPYSNVEYVISSIRQQMMAYNCLLQEKRETAEFVVEMRLGVLANDGEEVTYGVPSSSVKTAATAVPSVASLLPPIPEISFGRRNHQVGIAKIGVFAYDRVTSEPVWQSGLSRGTSEARDLWVLGLGPFQKGRIYKKHRRDPIEEALAKVEDGTPASMRAYSQQVVFERSRAPAAGGAAGSPSDVARGRDALPPIVSPNESPPGSNGLNTTPITQR